MKIIASLLFASFTLSAANVTFGAGSAVTAADRTATFNAVVTSTDLTNYTEDGLDITVPGLSYIGFVPGSGFIGGFHYPDGGTAAPTIISTGDSALMYGIEFTLGTGYFAQQGRTTFVAWETYRTGGLTGSGWFAADLSGAVIVGISDLLGFDEVHVANYQTFADVQTGIGSQTNAIALDNVQAELNSSAVPEPATIGLLSSSLLALAAARRYRR
jgi:hypothetical protein